MPGLCQTRHSETLGLIIDTGSVKPAGIMKTLSRTFLFVVLAVIAIVAVLTFRVVAQSPQPAAAKKFTLNIGRTTTDYVDVTSKEAFIKALTPFGDDQFEINFLDHPGAPVEHYPPRPKISIKTDKVTRSELAQRAPAGESAANDPSVTTHLSSDSATDIKSVLDTFK